MKEEYFGFYNPLQGEVDKSWSEGIFIFDANALLNLYRYSKSTRNDFLLAINKLRERIFMPYQVGFEFHNNRLNVIDNLGDSYVLLEKGYKDIFEKEIKNHLNQFKRHPSINLTAIAALQDDFLKKIEAEFNKQKKNHPQFKEEDEILTQLTEFYKAKVGKPFSKNELQKIYEEGKERYNQNVPPGYKDSESKKKKGDQHVYGDLIIWKEIIAFAKREKKLIIFVTDDRKEDWWTIENGKTLRPREELVKEFYDLTNTRILIYNTDSFLNFAKDRNLVSEIKETSINEVEEIRKGDETYAKISDFIKYTNSNIDRDASNVLSFSNAGLSSLITPNLSLTGGLAGASLLNLHPGMNTLSSIDGLKLSERYSDSDFSRIHTLAERWEAIKSYGEKLSDSLSENDNKNVDFTQASKLNSINKKSSDIQSNEVGFAKERKPKKKSS